ncbi:hypothetical protein B0T26DRAFT_392993 [Lasiosphaeria miniovina]|uniref:Uncharacterized protein n=1 Tax=Lasiosphaeria miniovina TaxID=1954250 RepID=A0AA40A4F3_9PEZI|nr:uncharacterized protein B0T26DRAFT_392993 [Lasiosphaeria miniovina]KAK0709062.1 hypothetical protein B0T26DRAFT_392993 [Lasiosphaeria miniovina]
MDVHVLTIMNMPYCALVLFSLFSSYGVLYREGEGLPWVLGSRSCSPCRSFLSFRICLVSDASFLIRLPGSALPVCDSVSVLQRHLPPTTGGRFGSGLGSGSPAACRRVFVNGWIFSRIRVRKAPPC